MREFIFSSKRFQENICRFHSVNVNLTSKEYVAKWLKISGSGLNNAANNSWLIHYSLLP